MKQRVITAICILVVAIPCIVLGGALLDCLVVFCALAGTYEYLHACMPERNTLFNTLLALLAVPAVINIFLPAGYTLILATIVLVVLYFFNIFNEKLDIEKISYLFQMFMLVTLGVRAFKDIRALGFNAVIYILLLTYVNDTMAMIGGKYLGKHKLIPRISPKKTVEGSITGYICGAAVGMAFGLFFTDIPNTIIVVASLVIPVVSALGDLAFSSIKRHYKIKDFSNLLPGHGGVLDRIDSLLFAMMVFSVVFMGVM